MPSLRIDLSDGDAQQLKIEAELQDREIGEVIRTGTQRELNLGSVRAVMTSFFLKALKLICNLSQWHTIQLAEKLRFSTLWAYSQLMLQLLK